MTLFERILQEDAERVFEEIYNANLREETVYGYHGSPYRNDRMDLKTRSKSFGGQKTTGIYFTDDKSCAATYGPYLKSAYINKGKNAEIKVNGTSRMIDPEKVPFEVDAEEDELQRGKMWTDTDSVTEAAKEEGYDSVTFKNIIDVGPFHGVVDKWKETNGEKPYTDYIEQEETVVLSPKCIVGMSSQEYDKPDKKEYAKASRAYGHILDQDAFES